MKNTRLFNGCRNGYMITRLMPVILLLFNFINTDAQMKRARDHGITFGILQTGKYNAITDVPGVKVGHVTIIKGDTVNTGVTAILPHDGNIFQNKVPAAIYISNGFGKLTGYSQVNELGNIETPVILTNTLSVPTAADALIDYTFSFPENRNVMSVNPVVGETNDARLNDIRNRHVTKEHVLQAINDADTGSVDEGNVGAGTGTVCFGFKGGIGTSSRVLPESAGGYTVGVLVQTNYGGILQINGVPVGLELGRYSFSNITKEHQEDGSCMIVIMTDAPLRPGNLKRLAARSLFGLARTGGSGSNSSGDYAIAVSTAEDLRIPYYSKSMYEDWHVLRNDELDLFFQAVAEATEEAIVNSLFAAEAVKARARPVVKALPVEKVVEIIKSHNMIRE
jgi:D-aminopeptidase